MSPSIELDLDAQPVGWLDRLGGERYYLRRSADGIGVDPKRMVDWRRIERLWARLDATFSRHSTGFWASADAASSASSSGQLWVISDDAMYTWVHETGKGAELVETNVLVSRHVSDSTFTAAVLTGTAAQEWRADYQMLYTYRRRADHVLRLFHVAVEARLDAFRESLRVLPEKSAFNYFRPAVITLEVDDRHHVIALNESGAATWFDSSVVSVRVS